MGGVFMEEKKTKEPSRIAKTVAGAMMAMNRFTDQVADEIVASMEDKMYEEKFCFDSCIKFCNENKVKYPNVAGFVLSVKKNCKYPETRGKYIIIQGLVDKNDKPVSADGKNSISRTIRADDVDEKTITYLDGDTTRIFTLK